MSETRLADRIAVQDVMLTYATSVDDRDLDRYASCFTEDVVVIGFAPDPLHGHAELLDFVRTALASFRVTQHLIAPPLVTFDGDTAHARTYVQALHYFNEPADRSFVLWATYETDFVRVGETWKITKHNLVRKASREE